MPQATNARSPAASFLASVLVLLGALGACDNGVAPPPGTGGAGTGATGGPSTSSTGGRGGAGGAATAAHVTISSAGRTPRASTLSVGYWPWAYGDPIAGTEALVQPLGFAILRMGGYNQDANLPEPFDDAELDRSVAYAHAIGAEALMQIPLLATASGDRPTADDAAAMVAYANVTKGYGIRYFSIGNEPDLYPDQGGLANPSLPAIVGYTPEQYCMEARLFVAKMKVIDPTIQIVGPDLGYKYQRFSDWLQPILHTCGDLFDIVAIHRYPFEAKAASIAEVAGDIANLRQVLSYVRNTMAAEGAGAKPLALTEVISGSGSNAVVVTAA